MSIQVRVSATAVVFSSNEQLEEALGIQAVDPKGPDSESTSYPSKIVYLPGYDFLTLHGIQKALNTS